MQLTFQKTIANSSFTLPIVCFVSVLLWLGSLSLSPSIALPSMEGTAIWMLFSPSCGELEDGWTTFTFGLWGWGIALTLTALCVYLMAELNNRFALLRISSRLISSAFALLCAIVTSVHIFHPGIVVALLSLLAFFTLFHTYQNPNQPLSFATLLLVSTASLVMPKWLMVVPLYWILLIYLRAFSFRCLVATVLGVILPYWFCFGVLTAMDKPELFMTMIEPLTNWQLFDYSVLSLSGVLQFCFVVLLFVVGVVDFFMNSFLDKSNVRALYHVVAIHGIYMIVLMCVMPQLCNLLLPVLMIDAAIVYGHFFALTYTRASHIINIVLLLMAILLIVYGID